MLLKSRLEGYALVPCLMINYKVNYVNKIYRCKNKAAIIFNQTAHNMHTSKRENIFFVIKITNFYCE